MFRLLEKLEKRAFIGIKIKILFTNDFLMLIHSQEIEIKLDSLIWYNILMQKLLKISDI